MPTQFYGIRHHGAGSARHLLHALQAQQPDLILLEAPPEAQSLLSLMAEQEMRPPIALLAYRPDAPQQAVYYPFAVYSPEWQAIQFAIRHGIEVRFFDLPLAHSLADQVVEETEHELSGSLNDAPDAVLSESEASVDADSLNIRQFPFDYLAEIAGLPDGEAFWEQLVEQRQSSQDVFEAVQIAVTALREHEPTNERDALREAYMRKMLRQAEKDAERVAVVCGAWHMPALVGKFAVKDDNALLKGLPKCKVDCTVIPWTDSRLTFDSGYGAGVNAPAWYEYLWHHPHDDGVLWISRAAALLRQQGFDISAAYVIETVRLANATAALRGQSRPNLSDFIEAVVAVMGMGDPALAHLIQQAWLVGNQIGSVPDHTPQLPLIADVAQQRKKCRLPETSEHKLLELDLRKPLDLQRSIFIHRMKLLDIDWADSTYSNSKGTFKEAWRIAYQPEHHIQLTERALFGNTLATATVAYVREQMKELPQLGQLAHLLRVALPADLPELVQHIAHTIGNLSADNHDLQDILSALPHLSEIMRYGTVRDFDAKPLHDVLQTLLARLAAGGVQGCLNIDTDSAHTLFPLIRSADYAVGLLDDAELTTLWCEFITQQMSAAHVHPLLSGNAARILFDKQRLDFEITTQLFSQHLSAANVYEHAANWLEGFLYQSGTILLIQDDLWQMIDDWLRHLSDETFTELLPLLRRTFSSFEFGEKRQLGDKAAQRATQTHTISGSLNHQNHLLNELLAQKAMATVKCLLGAA